MINCSDMCLVAAATGSSIDIKEEVGTMTIEGHLQYSNGVPYNISTPIVVNHGEYITYSRISDGNFTIHDIKAGVYIFDIHSPIHHFSQVKCLYKPNIGSTTGNQNDTTSTTGSTDTVTGTTSTTTGTVTTKPVFSCIEYYYPGAMKRTMDESNLLVFTLLASYEYFETKRGFSLLSILKNPMILMMVFTAGIMYMLPKMMEGMDPEERALMQKQMQMQQDPAQMMSQLFSPAGGTGSDNSHTIASSPKSQSSSTSSSIAKQSKKHRK